MARRNRQENEFGRPQFGRRRRGKKRYFAGLVIIGLGLFVAFLPSLVVRRSVLLPLVDRYAGLAPLTVDLDSVQAGWFKPAQIRGLRVLDADGHTLARVDAVDTQKGIWSWIRNSADLGTLSLRGVEAAVVASQGTTNVEQALAAWLAQSSETPADSDATANNNLVRGRIEVVDSKFLLMEAGRPEQWVVAVPMLSLTLPNAEQLVGPIELQASLADVSGQTSVQPGSLTAMVRQAEDSQQFDVQLQLDNVPVDVWHVIRARFPSIPVDDLHGKLSATLVGQIVDSEQWTLNVQKVESQGLEILAPEIVGESPARLEFIVASGSAGLAGGKLTLDGARLACDVAEAHANANLPWPLTMEEGPSMFSPFLPGAVLDARGSVDLPKLAKAAEKLLPLRADTQLLAGSGQFAVTQTLSSSGAPTSRAKLQLTGLQAISSGQKLDWNDPLTVEIAADRSVVADATGSNAAESLRIAAVATAEFCNLKAGGTVRGGQLSGNVDLDLLQKRLSQYVELPIQTMTGSAGVEAAWKMIDVDTLQAEGTLKTTPMLLASTTGGQVNEPAWDGSFKATAKLDAGTPQTIQNAQLSLNAPREKLTVDLHEPLALVSTTAGEPAPPAAAFSLNLEGDLANWKRRGTMWLTAPPELEIAGNLSLAVAGRVAMDHVEISEANWRSLPLQVVTPTMKFSEPEFVGNFKGLVDSSNLTRLVVEKLEAQASSFALTARDSAHPDGNGNRVGTAAFVVDLDRLLKNTGGATAPSSNSSYGASGRIDGQLNWQVSPQAAAVTIRADGQNVTVYNQSTGTTRTPLWTEPQLSTLTSGNWKADTGDIQVESLQVQTPWMNYVGNLAYRTENEQSVLQLNGEAVYDSVQLTEKLKPLIGSQLSLYGQQKVPIALTWKSSSDPTASSLAGLQASTRIGWQEARVAGIVLGKADVPLNIQGGQLATAAEFPVSGGTLRWDLTSDLTADELVLVQKPMVVLENVAITEQMCQGWLKYVAPLVAEATSVDGRLSLSLQEALLTPADPKKQSISGQMLIHNATVGPGPLSNQVITLVKQIEAIRKKDFTQAVSSTQKVWLNMPEQRIDFRMVDGRVIHQNVNIRIGDANISTSGMVAVDGQLEMLATMPIPDDWAEKSPLLAGMRGQSLQFPVGGTLSQPQMDTQLLSQFSRQTVQNAASGLIQQQLSKGLGKLFGTPPIAAPPTNQ